MCKNAYEQLCDRSKKIMIYCKLKDNEKDEMLRLCISQYYCSKEDKYVPREQKNNCKYYVE